MILFRKCIAEVIGTFALVFCATGAIIIDQQTNGAIGQVGMAITTGLVVIAMIYAVGEISGAHINPAVTIAFAVSGRFPFKQVIPYMLSQLAGALLASFILSLLFPGNELLGATLPSGPVSQSFIFEFILSFLLMFVIMQVSTGSKEVGMFAALAIGFTVLLEALFAGPISGASMNPARSLAPALVSGHLEHSWIYLAATIPGASAAIPIWKFLYRKPAD